MINKEILKKMIVTGFGVALFTVTGTAYTFDICNNIFDKMNQSDWRGDHKDRDDYYGYPGADTGYGYGRGRGYGYVPSGYGYGGPPAPGYGYTAPAYAAEQPGIDALQNEIYQLKMRIQSLEKALIQGSPQPQITPIAPGTG